LVVAALALQLSATFFQTDLNSDHLYPHMFVKDWLYGGYPLDAWKFGSATFLFPDYILYAGLLVLLGDSGLTFPVFAVMNMLLLGASFGLAIWRLGGGGAWSAWVKGYYLVGIILSFQFIPFHGYNLYWLLLPGFHGNCLTLGITICALLMGAWREDRRLSRGEALCVVILGVAGVFSNTLLLMHFLLPWLLTQLWLGWLQGQWKRAIFLEQLKWILIILMGVFVLRLSLAWLHYWEYGKVFRAFPFPAEVWRCWLDFCHDFMVETGPRLWFFWTLFVLIVGMTVWGHRRSRRSAVASSGMVFGLFSVISVGIAVILPILALYWKEFSNSRYFLNLLVLPLLALGLWVEAIPKAFGLGRVRSLAWSGLLGIAAVVLFGVNLQDRERLYFPYPLAVAEYDRMVAEYGLRLGVSDYWISHYYNQLSRTSSFLNHIEEGDGTPFFWCNNVYWFYGPKRAGQGSETLQFPVYDFILMNGLNELQVVETYGEPDRIVRGNYNTVYLYEDPEAIRSVLEPRIVQWLENKGL